MSSVPGSERVFQRLPGGRLVEIDPPYSWRSVRERAAARERQVLGALFQDEPMRPPVAERPRFADLEVAGMTDVIIGHTLSALRCGMFETREEALIACCLTLSRCRDELLRKLLEIHRLQPINATIDDQTPPQSP